MIAALNEQFLKAAICGMTEVVRTNQGFEIALPQAYASGNVVAVIVAQSPDGFTVHDNSYAAMVLERSGTPRAVSLANDVASGVAHYGCELDGMRVTRHCDTVDEVALSAILVGCASRLIADQALKVDKLPMFDFRARLLGTVTDIIGAPRIRTNEQVVGHLGSRYKVSTVILDHELRKPIAFVEPIADQNAVARRFKEFYDISLNAAYSEVQRVAVLDDEKGIPSGDVLLMQEVSTLLRFRDAPKMFGSWATVQ